MILEEYNMKLKVETISVNSDGTATIQFEMDDEYEKMIKKSLGVDELTEEMVQNYIIKAIENMVKEKELEVEQGKND